MTLDEFREIGEDAWISCWFHAYRQPGLERLPPRLWEQLRQRMQRIYREATGEEFATLIVEDSADGR